MAVHHLVSHTQEFEYYSSCVYIYETTKYISCLTTTSESYNDNATVQTADIATVQIATPGCQSKMN